MTYVPLQLIKCYFRIYPNILFFLPHIRCVAKIYLTGVTKYDQYRTSIFYDIFYSEISVFSCGMIVLYNDGIFFMHKSTLGLVLRLENEYSVCDIFFANTRNSILHWMWLVSVKKRVIVWLLLSIGKYKTHCQSIFSVTHTLNLIIDEIFLTSVTTNIRYNI